MGRSFARLLCIVVVGFAAAGCADHGNYELTWEFAGAEPATTGCGAHGVDSIRVIGRSTGGDGENFVVLCTDGYLTHSVMVGTWTLTVQQFDVRGVLITPFELDAQNQVVLGGDGNPVPAADPTISGDVLKDQKHPLQPDKVQLTPRPACSDGIDNDGDGRVDFDDPDCNRDPNKTSE